MQKKIIAQLITLLGASAMAQVAPAPGNGPARNVLEAVNKAVTSHPEVQARYHDFAASLEDKNIAKGGWRPQISAQGWVGREWRSNVANSPSFDWNRPGWGVELRQLIYDRSATSNDISRLGFEKLAKYYDLRATSEALAGEVVNAYLDVQRYRRMQTLAQDNYGVHQSTLVQLRERQQSGVGRGVDMEQANGRLSLAQVNLMTESNNLNDVTQRYRRLVGEYPDNALAPVPAVAPGKLPQQGSTQDFRNALQTSPAVLSKQALVQAQQAAQEMAQAAHAPKVELRMSTGRDRNLLSADSPMSNTQSSSVQVLLNYNLYRGGADDARIRRTVAQSYAAQDVRDYTCRNTQQDLSVTWNNIVRLRQQLPFLREHELSTSKVRTAYTQQFQIGQRSLLDLLDTENELFQARRALTNAEYDLKKYEYQWLTNVSQILQTLGLAQPHAGDVPEEQEALKLPDDVLRQCQSGAPDTSNLQPVALDSAAANAPSGAVPAQATPAKLAQPATAPASEQESAVRAAVQAWANAWASKDMQGYLGAYSSKFSAANGKSRSAWEKERQARIQGKSQIDLQLSDMKVQLQGTTATARFRQAYSADGVRDNVRKTLELVQESGGWRILRESVGS